MIFITRYWLLSACATVFLTILTVHHYALSGTRVEGVTKGVTKGVEGVTKGVEGVTKGVEEVTKGVEEVTKGVEEVAKEVEKTIIKEEEIEKIKKDLHTKIFKEIMNMTFYDDPLNRNCESNTNILLTKDSKECLTAKTIFFLETSNSPRLSARQACAVESAALHHPEWQVRVLFTSSQPLNLTDSFMKLLTLYENVRFLRMELDFIMLGTPLWYWYQKGSWKSSPHKIVHLSDAIRLCLLWKYGGIYLDTDVVVLRSLSKLRNTVSFDSGTNLGNSFLAFDRGQSLLRFTLIDFVSSYNPNGFASNGPVLLNRNFKEHCTPKSNNATDNRCHVNVIPRESVYPIDYSKWQEYFKSQTASLSAEAFKSSYIIHVWNKMSSGGKMIVGQNSWYEMMMKGHCQKVYELVADIGYA